ncbi:MAG: hypothetical protein IPI35_08895 [Deltaproteobacteria bacterium]|nr:hypothetical protein [Deltaproteobacteria bacterium]
MKICSLCGLTYHDRVDFCFAEGEPLVIATPQAQRPQPVASPTLASLRAGAPDVAAQAGGGAMSRSSSPTLLPDMEFEDDDPMTPTHEDGGSMSDRADPTIIPDEDDDNAPPPPPLVRRFLPAETADLPLPPRTTSVARVTEPARPMAPQTPPRAAAPLPTPVSRAVAPPPAPYGAGMDLEDNEDDGVVDELMEDEDDGPAIGFGLPPRGQPAGFSPNQGGYPQSQGGYPHAQGPSPAQNYGQGPAPYNPVGFGAASGPAPLPTPMHPPQPEERPRGLTILLALMLLIGVGGVALLVSEMGGDEVQNPPVAGDPPGPEVVAPVEVGEPTEIPTEPPVEPPTELPTTPPVVPAEPPKPVNPPTTPQVATTTTRLRLAASTPEAVFFVDNVRVGSGSDIETTVANGVHRVRAEAPGRAPIERSVDAKGGVEDLLFALKVVATSPSTPPTAVDPVKPPAATTGTVKFFGPSGARVFVGAKEVGFAGGTAQMSAGRTTFRVLLPSGMTYDVTQDVSFTAGEARVVVTPP